MDTITRWDFDTDVLKHPVTGYYVHVYVIDLYWGEWEYLITDSETGDVLDRGTKTANGSDYCLVASDVVRALEFI